MTKRTMAEGAVAKLLKDDNLRPDLGYGEARKMVRTIAVAAAATAATSRMPYIMSVDRRLSLPPVRQGGVMCTVYSKRDPLD